MNKQDEYNEFTNERFEKLYQRIFYKLKKDFEDQQTRARDKEFSYNWQTILAAFSEVLEEDALSTEAIGTFNIMYSLGNDLPGIMESLEPVRQRMLKLYYKNETPQPFTSKVTKRIRILGFIPTRFPLEEEIYNSDGELQETIKYTYDFSKENRIALKQAKTDEEKFAAYLRMRSQKSYYAKPLQLTLHSISGLPIRKKLFHLLVKYKATTDINSFIRDQYPDVIDTHNEELTNNTDKKDANEIEKTSQEVQKIEATRKRQVLAFYYLLNAIGLKHPESNKTTFAKFIAFMSAYDLSDSNSKITNTSFYSAIKDLFGGKRDGFPQADLEAVLRNFELMKPDSASLLTKAIEQIKKDMEA